MLLFNVEKGLLVELVHFYAFAEYSVAGGMVHFCPKTLLGQYVAKY